MAENLQQKPPLEDPLHEKELFASEIAGVGLVHGNVIITLANVRFEEPVGDQPAKTRRVVSGRIVLTNIAAGQLIQNLQQLAAKIETAAATAAGHKPN
jgi:hypothetical protein